MVDTDAKTAWQLFHLNWLPIATMGGLLALGLSVTGLRLEPVAYGITLAIAASFVAIAYRHRIARGDLADPKLIFSLGTIGQVIITCAIVGPLSYVAGKMGFPLQDQALLAIDRALGLDPEPIARFANDHPWLADVLSRGYGLIKWPLLGIPIVLALTARYVRLQLFMLAMSLALAVTIAISALVPAIGTYYALELPAAHLPDINTAIYAGQLRDILGLRDGSLHELRLFKLSGIVSFPSFHAASAVLYMWALWPVRRIGGIAAALNLLMIAATPVIGAHYIVDVAGGVAVAGSVDLGGEGLSGMDEPCGTGVGGADGVAAKPRGISARVSPLSITSTALVGWQRRTAPCPRSLANRDGWWARFALPTLRELAFWTQHPPGLN